MWPSLVFTTFICTRWVDSLCFSKYSVLFNVLSKRLHWISHLFLSTCLFKPSALLKTARQFSHLNSSLTHFAMWLFLLLYGILFLQWLHVTSLCVFSFMPPMHFFSHFSQVRTRSSCFAWICILRCFSKGASMRQMAQEDRWTDGWMRTSVCGTGRSKSAAYVCPNLPRMYAQICRVCMPKSAAQNETLDGDIEDRCGGGPRGVWSKTRLFPDIFLPPSLRIFCEINCFNQVYHCQKYF